MSGVRPVVAKVGMRLISSRIGLVTTLSSVTIDSIGTVLWKPAMHELIVIAVLVSPFFWVMALCAKIIGKPVEEDCDE